LLARDIPELFEPKKDKAVQILAASLFHDFAEGLTVFLTDDRIDKYLKREQDLGLDKFWHALGFKGMISAPPKTVEVPVPPSIAECFIAISDEIKVKPDSRITYTPEVFIKEANKEELAL
jgi:hypothetical protein